MGELTSSESRLLNKMVTHQRYFHGKPSKSAVKLLQLKFIEKTIDMHNFKITSKGLYAAELKSEGSINKYQYREIGEGDWIDCSYSDYKRLGNCAVYDTCKLNKDNNYE